ncbi:MAG: His/Gly/Thr/Pro-type tRNA ligase C-terminal domain-containing protein [Candidatus Paceibacterota bacterium]
MEINANEFLKHAIRTAEHFGFRSGTAWRGRKECVDCKVSLTHTAKAEERRQDGNFGLLADGINAYTSSKLHAIEEPVFYYSIEQVPRTGEMAIVFQIFGVEKSIAEAVLIQTLRSLLFAVGLKDHTIRINSLGDRDSQVRYQRELTSFFRKRLEDMPPTARELLKESATSTLLHLMEKGHDLAYKSPSPMEYLSDGSRRHFREIVEYLDMSNTPYEIDPKLIGHYNCYHDAIFSLDLTDSNGLPVNDQPLSIRGGRYGNFFEKHLNKNVPAVGAVLVLQGKKAPARIPRPRVKNPSVYLIHLGFAPKIRSLLLLDELSKSDIIIDQNLASDSLSNQLRRAEEKGARYTIILGQKEYVDRSVILRDMIGKSQETVPFEGLLSRLKKMHS